MVDNLPQLYSRIFSCA